MSRTPRGARASAISRTVICALALLVFFVRRGSDDAEIFQAAQKRAATLAQAQADESSEETVGSIGLRLAYHLERITGAEVQSRIEMKPALPALCFGTRDVAAGFDKVSGVTASRIPAHE